MLRFSAERIFSISNVQPETGAFASIGLVLGPLINYFYGDGRGNFIVALSLVIIMDWIAGIAASRKDGTYTSEYGIEGILRTIVILMLPAAANLLDGILQTPGLLFYVVIFGLIYHIFQSLTANLVRAKWDRWIPSKMVEHVTSEIRAKTIRAESRKKKMDQEEQAIKEIKEEINQGK